MSQPILNRALPHDPFPRPRLPGVAPLDPADWLAVTDAHAGQMAERERLIAQARDAVIWQAPGTAAMLDELLDTVIAALPDGYVVGDGIAVRPDGVRVTLDRTDPLATLGRLVQEDLCLLVKPDGAAEHVLKAAVLCFPAGWRLAEKADRPLTAIHVPVPSYDDGIAARVQRLFDGVRDGRPLWRSNLLWYDDPALFQARREGAPRPADKDTRSGAYLRTERQAILRLPRSGAVVFSIHTCVMARDVALALRDRNAGALVNEG
ncbi:heme-dependent oxidative N-demethylase family protein [Citreimonas salinaria]|uniref:DUF3445 domain-containing protein n=1 Tax=Citreimonas salinaria TaxID=321339 RepID=A0A1H3H265_9RHOB|nr:DUF3445 domain-containing protein [Citreimonas salinaria]SDY09295.1 Protein of unknown function [Citreimonas salinaria]